MFCYNQLVRPNSCKFEECTFIEIVMWVCWFVSGCSVAEIGSVMCQPDVADRQNVKETAPNIVSALHICDSDRQLDKCVSNIAQTNRHQLLCLSALQTELLCVCAQSPIARLMYMYRCVKDMYPVRPGRLYVVISKMAPHL